jgi:predicted secreted acid phosphatase
MSDLYFKGWPKNTNEYMKDLNWAARVGVQILDKYKAKQTAKPKCVIFDIDDTLVFGDPDSEVGVREMELGEHDGQEIFVLPPNGPIVKLAEYAKRNGFVIVVLTARPKTSREASRVNMNYFKIPYDAIIMNDGDDDPCFKVNVRRRIANKYDVSLTVGDQVTDVLCPGGGTAFIKLPDPTSKVSYAWCPI